MRLTKTLEIVVVSAIAAGTLTVGVATAVTAGASGTNTTYYACLKAGKLTSVGITVPACTGTETQISWNSQGPAGAPGANGTNGSAGPQGPPGATVNTCTSPPGPGLNFSECSLQGVLWDYADLEGTLLNGIDLNLADLNFANLTDTNLTGAVLTGAGLGTAQMTDANLTGAVLTDAYLGNATLTDANLTEADLDGATGLTAGNLTSVTWSNTTCPDDTNSTTDGGTCLSHLTP